MLISGLCDISLQLSELVTYLKSKGADISDEITDAESSLSEIVSLSDVLWKEGTNDAGRPIGF